MVASYLSERNLKVRRDKLINCIILVPIALAVLFTNYILIAAGNTNAWQYNSWLMSFVVIAFSLFFFLLNYSVMGVKFRIGKNQLENVMRHVFRNHGTKSRLQK